MGTHQPKSDRELRTFAWVMTGGLAVVGSLLLYKQNPAGPYLLGAAGVFLLAGLLCPRVLRPVEYLWMKLALVLGVVMTHVVLTLTFFVVITPLGLALALLGKRPMPLGFDRTKDSFWQKIDPDGPSSRPDKPY